MPLEKVRGCDMDSILTSIKKMLGIVEDYEQFDQDIIIHINSVFMILNQLGVGPQKGFSINDKTSTWGEYISDDQNLEAVKTYVYMKVRLMFDPPLTSAVADAMNRNISELEWRINAMVDNGELKSSDAPDTGKVYLITWTTDGYISTNDGSVKSEVGSLYSDFVETTPGSKLTITNTMTTDTQYNAFYDSDKKFLSSFSTVSGTVITVPENAKYFRLSKYTTASVVVVSGDINDRL